MVLDLHEEIRPEDLLQLEQSGSGCRHVVLAKPPDQCAARPPAETEQALVVGPQQIGIDVRRTTVRSVQESVRAELHQVAPAGLIGREQNQLMGFTPCTGILCPAIPDDIHLQTVDGLDPRVHASPVEIAGTKEIAPVSQGNRRRPFSQCSVHEVRDPSRRGQETVLAVVMKMNEGRHGTRC